MTDSRRASAPSTTLNDKTVIRGGWGIFYTQAFYPGWGGGMSLDGFSNDPSVSSSKGGIEPAMYLNQGFPIGNFALPLTSGPTTRTGRASTSATSTATSVRTRTSGTSRWIASSATSSR